MSSDDETKPVVIARPALLAELAHRLPESPEGRALATMRRVFGEAACGHLDDGELGLMLVVEAIDQLGARMRVGYCITSALMVTRWQLHHIGTGELDDGELLAPIELEAALRMLSSWARVPRRD